MSREIKFRVWDKRHKVFIKLPINSPESMLSGDGEDDCYYWIKTRHNLSGAARKMCSSDIEDCVFQQYTGLKDINDAEIYEGDVIKLDGAPYEYEVVWHNWRWGIDSHGIVSDDIQGFTSAVRERATVIGNIYENPKLDLLQ